jgi:hypothetical protein
MMEAGCFPDARLMRARACQQALVALLALRVVVHPRHEIAYRGYRFRLISLSSDVIIQPSMQFKLHEVSKRVRHFYSRL